jgi:hypothetical protein
MHSSVSLGYTRRIKGRRSLTPMRGKKRHHLKTRSWKKLEGLHVPVLQQANAFHDETRKETYENQSCQDSKWEGGEDSPPKRRWKDTEKHTQVVQERNGSNPKESLYPGTVCQMRDLSEKADASTETDAETQIEAEVIPS